jgi:hypothetical protein
MPLPATFEASWARAEAALYEALLLATKTRDQAGAFLGRLPPNRTDAWGLASGPLQAAVATWAPEISQVCIQVDLLASYRSRPILQAWAMAVMKALPFGNTTASPAGNVATARIRENGWGAIEDEAVRLANEQHDTIAWTMTIGLEMVFTTGGRQAEAPPPAR